MYFWLVQVIYRFFQLYLLSNPETVNQKISRHFKDTDFWLVVRITIEYQGELPKTDSEIASIKESHEKSINFDKNLFLKLDDIMNERDLKNFLSGLELHRHYQHSEFTKVGKFCERIRYEGNRYIDDEIRKL